MGRRLPDYARVCNCAHCRKELLGSRNPQSLKDAGILPVVFGHLLDRPYCRECYPKVYEKWLKN